MCLILFFDMTDHEDELNENQVTCDNIYLLFAILRKKDNPNIKKQIVIRQICSDRECDLKILKLRIQKIPGTWRIYESINTRNILKAKNMYIHKLIDDLTLNKYTYRLESLWKSCLMNPENKLTNYFLLDIDTKDLIIVNQIIDLLSQLQKKYEIRETINGYHIKTDSFDVRLLQSLKLDEFVEIKKDALFFLDVIKV